MHHGDSASTPDASGVNVPVRMVAVAVSGQERFTSVRSLRLMTCSARCSLNAATAPVLTICSAASTAAYPFGSAADLRSEALLAELKKDWQRYRRAVATGKARLDAMQGTGRT